MKLKRGNRVICIDADRSAHILNSGEIYTIAGVDCDSVALSEHGNLIFRASRFELVNGLNMAIRKLK